jgi:FMN phosphatase YigB (HAD superfamily)
MKPLYIFDLDGTLAHIEHRKHILGETDDGQRWRRFYAACDKDTPCAAVINTMNSLRLAGCEVWIFSGRSSEVREKSVAWLCEHTSFMRHELDTALTMRNEGDYTADDELKLSWLEGMLVDDRKRLVAVFDDRDRVVSMWRAAGVPCFQVAPGAF